MLFALSIAGGILSAGAWIYLLLGRGAFWRICPPAAPAVTAPASVTVIIPARNEAASIGRAISSLLQQSCAARLHIFVVDDNSSDGTAEAARAAAAENPGALTVVTGAPLPPGPTPLRHQFELEIAAWTAMADHIEHSLQPAPER